MATQTPESILVRVNIMVERRHIKEFKKRGKNLSLFTRGLYDRYLEDHPDAGL